MCTRVYIQDHWLLLVCERSGLFFSVHMCFYVNEIIVGWQQHADRLASHLSFRRLVVRSYSSCSVQRPLAVYTSKNTFICVSKVCVFRCCDPSANSTVRCRDFFLASHTQKTTCWTTWGKLRLPLLEWVLITCITQFQKHISVPVILYINDSSKTCFFRPDCLWVASIEHSVHESDVVVVFCNSWTVTLCLSVLLLFEHCELKCFRYRWWL